MVTFIHPLVLVNIGEGQLEGSGWLTTPGLDDPGVGVLGGEVRRLWGYFNLEGSGVFSAVFDCLCGIVKGSWVVFAGPQVFLGPSRWFGFKLQEKPKVQTRLFPSVR